MIIRFYFDGEYLSATRMDGVPRIGDKVSVDDVVYSVHDVCWFFEGGVRVDLA